MFSQYPCHPRNSAMHSDDHATVRPLRCCSPSLTAMHPSHNCKPKQLICREQHGRLYAQTRTYPYASNPGKHGVRYPGHDNEGPPCNLHPHLRPRPDICTHHYTPDHMPHQTKTLLLIQPAPTTEPSTPCSAIKLTQYQTLSARMLSTPIRPPTQEPLPPPASVPFPRPPSSSSRAAARAVSSHLGLRPQHLPVQVPEVHPVERQRRQRRRRQVAGAVPQ